MNDQKLRQKMSTVEYAAYLTRLIDHALLERFSRFSQGGWDENAITTEVCWELSMDSSRLVDLDGKNANIRWRAQRNSGRVEYNTGDIGLVINYKHAGGEMVTGFAHLEAKRIYFRVNNTDGYPIVGTGNFDSLSKEQVLRHLNNTHAHYVLLYDILEGNIPLATNLVSNRLLSLDSNKGDLHSVGHKLGAVLVHQFINGYGLDYRGTVQTHVKKWQEDNIIDCVLIGDVIELDENGHPYTNNDGGGQGPGTGGNGLIKTLAKHGFIPLKRRMKHQLVTSVEADSDMNELKIENKILLKH